MLLSRELFVPGKIFLKLRDPVVKEAVQSIRPQQFNFLFLIHLPHWFSEIDTKKTQY